MKDRIGAALLCLGLLLALIPGGALADANSNWLSIEGEEASVRLSPLSKYTFVTPENLDEYMTLCMARGNSEADVRRRFASENLVWEAYREGMDGCLRLEIYEDEWTHAAWDTVTMADGAFHRLPDELEAAAWLRERYYLFGLGDRFSPPRSISGKLLAYPPYEYESGTFRMHVYGGKAYMIMYVDTKPASSGKLYSQELQDMLWKSPLDEYERFRRDNEELANSLHMTDLLPDRAMAVFNLHPGLLPLKGQTETDAAVTLEVNGQTVQAQVKETEYTGSVEVAEGENTVILRATKNKRTENVIEETYVVNSAMAALALTEYPYLATDRDKLRVKGFTDPAGAVAIRLNDGEAQPAEIREDGSFEFPFEAEDWKEQTIEITASQEGLEDCTVKLSFTPQYEDVEKGIRAYRKTLADEKSLDVVLGRVAQDPEAYIGKRYTAGIDLRATNRTITYENGYITIESIYFTKDENGDSYFQPVIFICDDYAEDFISIYKDVDFLGEVIEPTLTTPAVPRFHVQYIIYH